MPKTKLHGIIFGILMSISMAMGMEIYNTAINMGFAEQTGSFSSMTNAVFVSAIPDAFLMAIPVFIFSNLWGNRFGAAFGRRHTNPETDNPYFCTLMRQAGTIAIMCPTMSLFASIVFQLILGDRAVSELFAIWIGTMIKNLPMAFFWNMFVAAPFCRWAFQRILNLLPE